MEEPLGRPHLYWLPSNPFLILQPVTFPMYTVPLLKTPQWLCSAFRIKTKCPSQKSYITGALWPPCWISDYLTQSSSHSGLPLLDCAHARHLVWNVLPCPTSSSCCLQLSRLQPRPNTSREACPGPQVGLKVFVTRFHQPGASFLNVLLGLSWNIPLGDPVEGPWLTETVNSLKAGPCLCLLVTAFLVLNPESRTV